MSLIKNLNAKLTREVCKFLFERQAAKVLQTPAVVAGDLPYTLLSMVQHRDVQPYLVALKSFTRQAPPSKVVIVCDPSITEEDKTTFRKHIANLELRAAAEFTAAAIPRGGTWERLFAISEYAASSYVVQLDADTVTVGAVDEVVAAIRAERGFVIGEQASQCIEALTETSARAKPWLCAPYNSQHIQAVVEAAMDDVGISPEQRYVRGCSGFTGFPMDAGMRDKLLAFSALMHKRHGQRWAEWGTEQITSNFLVANARDTQVLPFPKYGTPDSADTGTVFLHFIGYLRFINRKYEKTTRTVIRELGV